MKLSFRFLANWRVMAVLLAGALLVNESISFFRIKYLSRRISEKRSFIEGALLVQANCGRVKIGMRRGEVLDSLGSPVREFQTPSARGDISSLIFSSAGLDPRFPQVDLNVQDRVVAVACAQKFTRVASAADWDRLSAPGPIATDSDRP
jgi:hypothetical protein